MTETKPKRRWFRFSLKTMLLVITAIAVWLGYQFNRIRERHQFLAQHFTCQPSVESYPGALRMDQSGKTYFQLPDAPWPLGILGESPRLFLLGIPAEDVERARKLFPEASINWGLPAE